MNVGRDLPTQGARARAFGGAVPADIYDRFRPGYPAAAIRWLLNNPPGRLHVLDLGAGTGKLSTALRREGHQVVAVDPSLEMLGVLRGRLAEVPALVGRGENIPLKDGCVDAVSVGQAWHWMDGPSAAAEAARVLKPGGGLALVWNVLDGDTRWVAELQQLTSDRTPGSADTKRHEPPSPFHQTAELVVPWTHWLDSPEQLAEVASTWSWVAVHPERDRLLTEVARLGESVQDNHARVGLPYKCYSVRYIR